MLYSVIFSNINVIFAPHDKNSLNRHIIVARHAARCSADRPCEATRTPRRPRSEHGRPHVCAHGEGGQSPRPRRQHTVRGAEPRVLLPHARVQKREAARSIQPLGLQREEGVAHSQRGEHSHHRDLRRVADPPRQTGERPAPENCGTRDKARIHATHEKADLPAGQAAHKARLPRVQLILIPAHTGVSRTHTRRLLPGVRRSLRRQPHQEI